MKYLFALGKFPQISAYEIKSYFLAGGIEFKEIGEFLGEMPFAVYGIEHNLNAKKMIEELGGTIKIAKIVLEIETRKLLGPFTKQSEKKGKAAARKIKAAKRNTVELEFDISDLDKKYLGVRGAPKEIGISLYFYSKSAIEKTDWEELNEFLETELKQIAPTPSIVTPQMTKYSESSFIIPSESFARDYAGENSELVIGIGKEKTYFGVVEGLYNIDWEKKRGDEMLRPQHWKFGIRTRLGKTLINLARAKQGDILLDPFCGIGVVLKEAILNDIHVIGRDLDGNAIKFAAANMEATLKSYRKNVSYDIDQGDARKINLADNSVDAVATEPYLGKTLKQRPKQDFANQIINELRPIYTGALKEIYRILKPEKFCAIISPLITTGRGQVRVDVKKIANQIGFEVKAPLVEGEHYQIVKREIYVLKKI
ncbi:TPA: methyltransferase domain-containing protein [archaeon]|uniref:Methyltransferase domain-containing protein n=1 Tax=Candidatus Naiadarchaeum limnaeum TaxID=2756139 RepID=A0A832UZ18_9ARCH|nr:methyltransferase domain-containing protein [Candidatus Naiadarchaeum limnaeum]